MNFFRVQSSIAFYYLHLSTAKLVLNLQKFRSRLAKVLNLK